MSDALFVGWDVGGWHGRKDGLAALRWSEKGQLSQTCCTFTGSLSESIWDRTLTLSEMAALCGVDRQRVPQRVVLGVDAPLGYPTDFVRATAAGIGEPVPPQSSPSGPFIENTLAFRQTDRHIHRQYGKHPLSPSLDSLNNNVTKARAALAVLRGNSNLRVMPFERDRGRAVAIEVYPALWKLDPTRKGKGASHVRTFESEATGHELDALLCALTAACYESRNVGINSLPLLEDPPNDPDVRAEGWIYAPLTE